MVAKINLCGGNNRNETVGGGVEIGGLHKLGIGERCKDEKKAFKKRKNKKYFVFCFVFIFIYFFNK